MEEQSIPYEKQIFVCTNNGDGTKQSCTDHGGGQVFRQLRNLAKERGLHPKIRVAQATCLGQCANGVNVMVYPDNQWYSGVLLKDVSALAKKYLGGEKKE